jgi:hypothetical protein
MARADPRFSRTELRALWASCLHSQPVETETANLFSEMPRCIGDQASQAASNFAQSRASMSDLQKEVHAKTYRRTLLLGGLQAGGLPRAPDKQPERRFAGSLEAMSCPNGQHSSAWSGIFQKLDWRLGAGQRCAGSKHPWFGLKIPAFCTVSLCAFVGEHCICKIQHQKYGLSTLGGTMGSGISLHDLAGRRLCQNATISTFRVLRRTVLIFRQPKPSTHP